MTRTIPPGELERDLLARLATANQQVASNHARRRGAPGRASSKLVVLVGLVSLMLVGVGSVFADGGSLDVQVADKTQYEVDTTTDGAIVEYIGDDNVTFGAAGSGVFESFLQTQDDPSEEGYNTDGVDEFDTGSSPTFNHSILVSEIPVVACESLDTSETHAGLCWELFADINDSNANDPAAAQIQLTELEIWFTDDNEITGYDQGGTGFGADGDLVYNFEGVILINDVNQGSGRGDLRYLIPLDDISLPIPADCDYGNSSCTTFFVVYTEWGDPADGDYKSDSGFEEWKVKRYPIPDVDLSKTPSVTDVCSGANTSVTYTYVVTNSGETTISGTVVDDNGTPGVPADDVTVGTYTDLAVGDTATFMRVTTVNATTTNIATTTATSPDGLVATATATATVTAHDCDIEVTKSPSQDDVCSSANTEITYTYHVINAGDVALTNVTVSDDTIAGAQAAFEAANGASDTLGVGADIMFTLQQVITTDTTNTVTATGDAFGLSPADTDTAQATVDAHDCDIEVTKEAPAETCTGTEITYTYHVINAGDVALTNVTVSDDTIAGAQAAFEAANGASDTLAVGADVMFTINATHGAPGSVTNTVTATGDAFGLSPADTDTAQATVVVEDCGESQITPTGTECGDFVDGTATDLPSLEVNKAGKMSPGAFIYFASLSSAGVTSIEVEEFSTPGAAADPLAFDAKLYSVSASGVCTNISSQPGVSIAIVNNVVTYTLGAGFDYAAYPNLVTYVKYSSPTGVAGTLFTFTTAINGVVNASLTDTLTVIPK